MGSGGNLFGNIGGGLQLTRQNGNIFGSSQNQQPNNGGNLFGNSQNNGLLGLGSQNSNGGLFGSIQSVGTYNLNYNPNNLPTRNGLPVLSISEMTKDKSLEQLRVEDYFSVKNRKIPDQLLSQIQNQWQQNQQARSGGGIFNGSGNNLSNGLFGNGNNGGILFGNSGGNLFGNKNGLGGGLLGNNSQNGSGLFGGNQGNGLLGNGGGLLGQKPLFGGSTGGGLFGGNSGGGLFSGNSGGNGGGLFGGSSSSGGLFGNSGSGLFGNQNKQGGLFGNSGGLFGGSGQSSGGLFSGLGGNKSGSLFGGSNGGLFGNSSGGLFGNSSGGLFGGSSSGGLFGSSSSGGLFGSSSGGLFSGQSGGLFSGLNRGQSGGLFSSWNNNGQYGTDARTLLEAQLMGGGLDLQQAQFYDMIRVSFGSTQQNYNLFGKTIGSPESQSEIHSKYDTEKEFPSLRRNDRFSYSPFDRPSFSRRNYIELCPDLEARLAHRNKLLSSKKKDQPLLIGRKFSEREPVHDEEDEVYKKIQFSSCHGTPIKKPLDLTKMYDSVRFSVTLNQKGKQFSTHLDMHLNTTCLEIKRTAIEKIYGVDDLEYSKYKLVYKNKILHDSSKIKEIKLRENDKIYLITNSDAINYSHSSLTTQPSLRNILAPESLLPKLTKDYLTEPSMLRISRMSEEELSCVENFSISNEDVKVTFEGETDIKGLDLDEIVQLGYRAVQIYPESGKVAIPQAGTGLNKAAVIEFKKWPVPKKYENDAERYIMKLKNWATSIDAEFKYYDPEGEVLCIRVNDFNMKSL